MGVCKGGHWLPIHCVLSRINSWVVINAVCSEVLYKVVVFMSCWAEDKYNKMEWKDVELLSNNGVWNDGMMYGMMEYGMMEYGMMEYGMMEYGMMEYGMMEYGWSME